MYRKRRRTIKNDCSVSMRLSVVVRPARTWRSWDCEFDKELMVLVCAVFGDRNCARWAAAVNIEVLPCKETSEKEKKN
jgi:hypothetical protein